MDSRIKVKIRKPPIWFLSLLFQPQMVWGENVGAFTWGDTIYCARELKSGELMILPDIFEHEKVHVCQQGYSKAYGIFVILFYLVSGKFRYACELEAFRRQYEFYCEQIKDRNILAKLLYEIVANIADGDYGFNLNYEQIRKDLNVL